VPGIHIPKIVRKRIATAGEDAPGEGVRVAIELLEELKPHVQGAYIMSAFGRYDLVADVIEAIRDPSPRTDPC
jgi:homocysteine S-methyltransferase